MRNIIKITILLSAAVILLLAWAPWLTEDYAKEKVLDYFNQSYGVDKSDIRIGSVEKKPFEIDFGLYFPVNNSSLGYYKECYDRTWITIYGEVKHEPLKCT